MCQVFNLGAALALRAYLRERRAGVRLPDGSVLSSPENIVIVQGLSPTPEEGSQMAFIYGCAQRGIGYKEPSITSANHVWIELRPDAASAPTWSVDFACHQFGLGSPVDSSKWLATVSAGASTSYLGACTSKDAEPSAQLIHPKANAMRPWALVEPVEYVASARVLKASEWRADSSMMATLEQACQQGCGLDVCMQCRGKVFGGSGGKVPRKAKRNEFDPITEILRAPGLWAKTPDVDLERANGKPGAAHMCRRMARSLLTGLRVGIPS